MSPPIGAARAGVMSTTGDELPDSEVYLHDDWGDNKLQNRDDSGTTTWNGVTGVYRPEWTIASGSPTAQNQQLQVGQGDQLHASINLSFSNTITWSIDISNFNADDIDGQAAVSLFASTTTYTINGIELNNGYTVRLFPTSGFNLRKIDSGSATNLVSGSTDPQTLSTITVTRDSSGNWELSGDGSSEGTASDSTFTTASHTAFAARSTSSPSLDVNEYKVS